MAASIWPRRLAILGGVVVAAAGGGYFAYTKFFEPHVVTTSRALLAPVSEAVYGNGTVEPERWAKVVPLARARLVELCRCEGQAVTSGQVLGKQDDAEERNQLQQLQINQDQLDRNLKRAQDDKKDGKITQAQLEDVQSQVNQGQSRIAAEQTRLDGYVLKAPLDGMVLRRDGEVGEIVGPTDVLFWVGPPLPLQVVADINEEDITRITIGQKAFLRSEAFTDQSFPAAVSQITPKGDPTRKTFRVYLRLPDNTPLRIGMSVEVNIIYREKPSAIVVPTEAIMGGNAVQVVSGGKIRRVPVTVGVRGTRTVEIIGDVSRDTLVLSPAHAELAEGARVQFKEPPVLMASARALNDAVPVPDSGPPASDDSRFARSGLNYPPAPPSLPGAPPSLPGAPPSLPAPTLATAPAPAADSDTAVLSAALNARIDSIVNDARRDVTRYGGSR
jgi:membrane fusion protein, multidrug efflux system